MNASFYTPHPNLARFVEFLRHEEENIFFKLTRVFGGIEFDLSNKNLKKEQKLQILIKEGGLLDENVYFKLLDSILEIKIN